MLHQIDVLNKKQKLLLTLLLAIWFVINIIFVTWWLDPSHVYHPFLFVINTIVLFWTYLLPAYFFFFITRMKKTNPQITLPDNLRVAMVVTKAPSEPIEMIQKTIKGMLNQKYPHDTWIADEDPTEEIKQWASENGVYISSRKGIDEYNRDTWPRRKKCKEGNLTYFYNMYGYYYYDIVVQLDADHVPQDGYLEEMLKPFVDEKIGYVSAPSICSSNADHSWAARARLYAEGLLHGAQQAGHGNGFAPLCFGSHYAVRTKALYEIGGLGPELAEDHSTSMIMNANGWRGAHAIDALAIGDGPETFADAMTQEFQWSRSLMNLLLMWTPKYIKGLPWKMKVQFVFAQLWYLLYSSMMLIGFLIPLVAIVTNTPFVSVSYASFAVLNFVNIAIVFSIMRFLKKNDLLRPYDAKLISWEAIVFQLARWPWTLFGVLSSVHDFIRQREFAFKVTPKNKTGYTPLPIKAIAPYLILLLLYILVVVGWGQSQNVLGYYYFGITGILMYLATFGTIVIMHEYENS